MTEKDEMFIGEAVAPPESRSLSKTLNPFPLLAPSPSVNDGMAPCAAADAKSV